MIFSKMTLSFEMLEKAFGFPEGVKIVAVSETMLESETVQFRILSENPPRNIKITSDDPRTKMGQAFIPLTDTAEVEVVRAAT